MAKKPYLPRRLPRPTHGCLALDIEAITENLLRWQRLLRKTYGVNSKAHSRAEKVLYHLSQFKCVMDDLVFADCLVSDDSRAAASMSKVYYGGQTTALQDGAVATYVPTPLPPEETDPALL